jgi:hypothetical protein
MTNNGDEPIWGTLEETCDNFIMIIGGLEIIDFYPYGIQPGESLFVTVRFTPTEETDYACIIDTGTPECPNIVCTGAGVQSTLCFVGPDSLMFGNVALNDSLDVLFLIINIGDEPFEGDVQESCDNFSLVSGGGHYVVNPDDIHAVTVRFTPTEETDYSCTIDTGTPNCADVSCTGTGVLCLVEPDTLDFGNVVVLDSHDLSFHIVNINDEILNGNITESCDDFSLVSGGGSFAIDPNDTHFVTVRFLPTEATDYTCIINTGDNLCRNVVCIGKGGYPYLCLVEPDTLKFHTVALGDSFHNVMRIVNLGFNSFSGTVREFCDDFTLFTAGIPQEEIPFTLAPTKDLYVTVRFKPTVAPWDYTCIVTTGSEHCDDVVCIGTGAIGSAVLPNPSPVFALHQNRPNPFNPTTTISFTLPERSHATLSIYNVEGKLVKTLVNDMLEMGYEQIVWDGTDLDGNSLSSGIYFYQLKAEGKKLTKKMILLK